MSEQEGEGSAQSRAVHEFGGETLEGVAPSAKSGDVVFGRYRLDRVLGVGGMGVVWLAIDEKLEQEVALKFVPDTLRHDESAIDDLKKQTKIGLKLSHPNIVRVAGFEEDGDLAGIVMEYVDGPTLAAMRIDQPAQVFEADTLHAYAAQLLDALEYAHTSAAMVHRDVKPANLMVNASDQVKVTDFGIACSIRDSVSRMTMQPKAGSGTLLYMSPQQMMGTPPSESDDIYSLGVTLFELMTGAPPFYTGDVQTQVRDIAAPSVTERRAQEGIEGEAVPEHWETVIAACLAKEPALRPSTVAEVRKGLAGKKFTRGPRGRKSAAASVGPTPTEVALAPPAGAAPRGRAAMIGGGIAAVIAAGFFIVTSGGDDKSKPDQDPEPKPQPEIVEEEPKLEENESMRKLLELELKGHQEAADKAEALADDSTKSAREIREAWDAVAKALEDFEYPYNDDAKTLRESALAESQHWSVEERFEKKKNELMLAEINKAFKDAEQRAGRSDLGAEIKAGIWDQFIDGTDGLKLSELTPLVAKAKTERDRWKNEAANETPAAIPNETQFFAARAGWKSHGRRELLKRVQNVLVGEAHYPHSPDGAFGPLTYSALLDYQSAKSLPKTGVLDPPTLEKMGLTTMAEPIYVAARKSYSSPSRSHHSGGSSSSTRDSDRNVWERAALERFRSGNIPSPF